MAKKKPARSSNSTPASVTLRELADDLDYWILQVRQYAMPGTGSIGTQKLHRKGIDGLVSLATVIRGYAQAGFRIEPGTE